MGIDDYLKLLRDTPVPSLLVIGGIAFLLLSVLQKAGASVETKPGKERFSIISGIILLLCGIGLYLVPPAQQTIATATSLPSILPNTQQPLPSQILTNTSVNLPTDIPTGTLMASAICSDNLLAEPWHLEATNGADEKWLDFSDQYILKGKDLLRVTYNLHGLIAKMGDRKNDSVIVFNQPDWYGISLADPKYGTNGLDGDQTIDIPLSDFVELPNPDAGIVGGKPLDLDSPVSSIRARFWHNEHFNVDITYIAVCSLP